MLQTDYLAAVGSTGNVTGTGVAKGEYDDVEALSLVVEAVGATPTATFKFQGSFDNSNWFDILYVTDSSDILTTSTRVVTAVGNYVNFPVRFYQYHRVVVTANTNVTYSAVRRSIRPTSYVRNN